MNLIEEVKKKKEFSKLPDSIVERALNLSGDDVKEARNLLRKYFGVFLTNKVLKGKGEMLGLHISSKKRDYKEFYGKIFENISSIGSVIDLGCGVNGFSFPFLREFGVKEYYGVEASGQLVDLMNKFFEDEGHEKFANAIWLDLFEIEKVVGVLKGASKPRVVFIFQVIDALENIEKDFSKKFIFSIMGECETLVISLPLVSLGGRKKFAVQRKWLTDFLEENFLIEKDFEMFGERILIIGKK